MPPIRMTIEQIRALASLSYSFTEAHDASPAWEVTMDGDGILRIRDAERDFYIAPDGSLPWG